MAAKVGINNEMTKRNKENIRYNLSLFNKYKI
jgi:hypothetical protein